MLCYLCRIFWSMKLERQGQRIAVVIFLFIITLVVVFLLINKTKVLPVYQPSQINEKLVDSTLQATDKGHHILPFALKNQDNEIVSEKTIAGKITVVDFFFTTCGSICPRMTDEMERISEAYAGNDDFHLLSYTVYPEVDSVETLKAYALARNLNTTHWDLLTGNKKEIYKLARQSYFAVTDEPSLEGPDFIHTENFVLVDGKGQLRGFYDGTNPKSVDVLIEDIAILQEETK